MYFNFNRDDRIRTCDILLPKQARYQAALHPVVWSATLSLLLTQLL
jgi:hypothetical protein